ncbi:uncharacterized protein LOC131658807 [Vicia villosa]|uniref:uncharacterized protein LOC131658807 n=1 Tax=Vicia villosa TaxID=3911 RepID=UPI00273C9793|nr:uncharacterized protein LOC131658807 [Vicia villosa]
MNKRCSFFFGSCTKEVKPFKNVPITIRSDKCIGFSHCPSSFKCIIADFDECKPPYYRTLIFRLVDDRTNNASLFNFECGYFYVKNKSPNFHNGSFYYLSDNGTLGFIKLTERGASRKKFNTSRSPCTNTINSFIVECNGNQLSVFEGPFGKWVEIFELNKLTMTWTKVESLVNHMYFVGNTSFFAKGKIAGMENKIYFPRFYGGSTVFYSSETKKFYTFEDEVANFESVREPPNYSWI